MIYVTSHAYEKGRERLSLNKKSLLKLTTTAFERGLKHTDLKASLKKYIDKLFFNNSGRSKNFNIRIYGEVLFIFDNERLITLYQIPSNLKKYTKL